MNTTNPNVTAIRVVTNTDHLFEGSDYDAALCNEDATRAAYLDQLGECIAERYPAATVNVRADSVYHTTVSTDTDQDNSGDEETRTRVLETEQAVADDVDDAGITVYARGTFWVAAG